MTNRPAPSKIQPDHLRRQAFIYVRQSTLGQVRDHTASTARQYDLTRCAQDLGWPHEHIVVIDEDQGRSGASATERSGFQHLVAEVGLGHAGAVFSLEASRLARRSSDWHRLLEICAISGTLVIDEDGVYDPSQYNDRLLLGFKGAMSEAELHFLRQRLLGGKWEKARQGTLRFRLPVGYVYDAAGRIVQDPDEQVQQAVRLVFDLFDELGTASAVVRHFRVHRLLFPVRERNKLSELLWRPLNTRRACMLLHNPLYTGTYVYGRSQTTRHRRPVEQGLGPAQGRKQRLAMEDWAVVLRDAHPAYISWERFLKNQQRLQQNRTFPGRRGAAREGPALLQGIALCGQCGRGLSVAYLSTQHRPYYLCHHERTQLGGAICQTIRGDGVDQAVSALFLEAMQPVELEVSMEAIDHLERRARQIERQWALRLERARYEVDLAQRRYRAVEPEHRLVARSLERDWNEKLAELERLEREQATMLAPTAHLVSPQERARILELAQDLPAIWQAETTSHAERKQLLRLLVKDVTLTKREADIHVGIRWQTEAVTEVAVPYPQPVHAARRTDPAVVERVRALAATHPDSQIAAQLTQEGVPSKTGKTWRASQIGSIRRGHGIKSGCPESPALCPGGRRGDGRYSAQAVATMLNVGVATVASWCKQGRLDGVQAKPGSPWWIRLTPEVIGALRRPRRRRRRRSSSL